MSYDENYESYLKAMGIPFFVVPIILGSSATLTVEAADNPDETWVLTTANSRKSKVILKHKVL